MEGSKQCPECKCTDVPINAEICPFCGYSFGGQTEAKPAGTGKQTEAQPTKTEKKPETTGFVMDTNKEPAIPKTKEEVKPPVSEDSAVETGTAGPVSTDYTTYKKKGGRKQADSRTSQKGQGAKAAIGWLAAGLIVAVLLMTNYSLSQMMSQNPRMEYLAWLSITGGMMTGFLHVCCYTNEKGSRGAGALGIIAGAAGLLVLLAHMFSVNWGSSAGWFGSVPSQSILRGNIIRLVNYALCWLIAAKLAHNKKSVPVFCLTAAELVLFPYLANWIMYRTRPQLSWTFAAYCAAMLLTDFLLHCIRAWLAVKPRKLFWILYVIVMLVALVSIYESRYMLFNI